MPTLSSPWYQQRPQVGMSLSPQPPPEPKKLIPLSDEAVDAMNERLSRPTIASRARQSLSWKMDSFMERGRCSWTKMELFRDCKKSLWTNGGTVKRTCQIRPVSVCIPRTSVVRLPQPPQPRPYTGLYRY